MTNHRLILVAQPNPEVLRSFTQALLDGGYEVVGASTAAQCLAAARERHPGVAVIAGSLPDAVPLELCKELKLDPALTGILVVLTSVREPTGSPDPEGNVNVAGPDDWIPDGLSGAELLNRTRLWVRLQETAEALTASTEKCEQVLELLPDAAGLIDSEGRLLEEKPHVAAMLGYNEPKELLGKTVFDFALPEDRARIREDTLVPRDVPPHPRAGMQKPVQTGANSWKDSALRCRIAWCWTCSWRV